MRNNANDVAMFGKLRLTEPRSVCVLPDTPLFLIAIAGGRLGSVSLLRRYRLGLVINPILYVGLDE
jgi:hypothetical protein